MGQVAAGNEHDAAAELSGGAGDGLAEAENIVGRQVRAGQCDQADTRCLCGEVIQWDQDAMVERAFESMAMRLTSGQIAAGQASLRHLGNDRISQLCVRRPFFAALRMAELGKTAGQAIAPVEIDKITEHRGMGRQDDEGVRLEGGQVCRSLLQGCDGAVGFATAMANGGDDNRWMGGEKGGKHTCLACRVRDAGCRVILNLGHTNHRCFHGQLAALHDQKLVR